VLPTSPRVAPPAGPLRSLGSRAPATVSASRFEARKHLLVARESSETAKLLDFGVAKFLRVATDQLTTDTAPGVVLGTPRYMSPEQCHGGEAHPTWDLWALAIVTYEMLVGAYPFDVRSSADWLWAGPVARFAPVAAHLPDAPRRWQEFFEHYFAFDPTKHPQSIPMFLSELRGALS
jgi:serine/threonine protein kinase